MNLFSPKFANLERLYDEKFIVEILPVAPKDKETWTHSPIIWISRIFFFICLQHQHIGVRWLAAPMYWCIMTIRGISSYRAETKIWFFQDGGWIIIYTHHSPKPILNICHLPGPPIFSFVPTFKSSVSFRKTLFSFSFVPSFSRNPPSALLSLLSKISWKVA